ncbi:MAG: DUF1286 domain-containing protein [Thermoprotei archaeon]
MRLITHYVFSFSTLLPFVWITPLINVLGGPTQGGGLAPTVDPLQLRTVFVAVCAWLSFCVNFVLDRAGHNRVTLRGGLNIPVRAWRTHSVYTAPVWGGLIGFLTALILRLVQNGFSIAQTLQNTVFMGAGLILVFLGAYASYTHLLLDSLTGGGVYTKRHRRIALAHFKYNNPALNFGVILLSIILTYYILVQTTI